MIAEDLYAEDEHPTPDQFGWSVWFAVLWNSTRRHPVKSGRTWFWRRVVRFLREHEPEAFDE